MELRCRWEREWERGARRGERSSFEIEWRGGQNIDRREFTCFKYCVYSFDVGGGGSCGGSRRRRRRRSVATHIATTMPSEDSEKA